MCVQFVHSVDTVDLLDLVDGLPEKIKAGRGNYSTTTGFLLGGGNL